MFNAGDADGTALFDMKGKGAFSYQNDDRNYVRLDDETRIFIQRINTNIARVYLVNNNEEQVPLRSLHMTKSGYLFLDRVKTISSYIFDTLLDHRNPSYM